GSSGPAEEARANLGVAPRQVRGARDPDAGHCDRLDGLLALSQLERRAVEPPAVELLRDPERLAEAAWAAAEEAWVVEPASCAHHVEAVRRLERTNQGRTCHAFGLADEVEAPVDSVRAVDVRVAGRAEHRGVALRPSLVAVAGRVLLVVRLDLDDPAAEAVHEERCANELGRDLVHAAREEIRAEHARRSG